MTTAVVRSDHHVVFRREESISYIALQWREAAGNSNFSYFNIVDFVLHILSKFLKGGLQIRLFDAGPNDKPAYVDYKPTTMHVDREIWRLAQLGEPEARYIIAHEIGHVILHDHTAKAFSNDPREQIKFSRNEYSAEWQANTFAFYFLMPTHIVAAFDSSSELARSCGVPESLAAICEPALHRRLSSPTIREGDLCSACGNLTITSDGRCQSEACRTQPLVQC
jgi:hypothetical protein